MDRPLTPEQMIIIAMLMQAYVIEYGIAAVTGHTPPWWVPFTALYFPRHDR